MWGLSPDGDDNGDDMECDVSGSPPQLYIDSDEVPCSSSEDVGDEPMDGEWDLTKSPRDPCRD